MVDDSLASGTAGIRARSQHSSQGSQSGTGTSSKRALLPLPALPPLAPERPSPLRTWHHPICTSTLTPDDTLSNSPSPPHLSRASTAQRRRPHLSRQLRRASPLTAATVVVHRRLSSHPETRRDLLAHGPPDHKHLHCPPSSSSRPQRRPPTRCRPLSCTPHLHCCPACCNLPLDWQSASGNSAVPPCHRI